MPDRDVFTALHPLLRDAARNLLRAARGEAFEFLDIAEAINHLMAGGIASLGRMLKCIAAHQGDESQASWFQDGSFANLQRSNLNAVRVQAGNGWKDELLCQEAIRACRQGVYDTHSILRRVVMNALTKEIIVAQGGVESQLARKGLSLDARRLEERLLPLLDTAAALMQRTPQFKRLGLASRFRHAVDLHENLL